MRSILVGLVCACLCVRGAVAQKTAMMQPPADVGVVGGVALCPPCLHDQMLTALPASVEMVIAVNNGAKQRSSPAGKALAGMLAASGTWTETIKAWEELARALDWTPERTFDELLGRRISLVARDLEAAGGPEWAVLSAVSDAAERRLRERLRAAPRGAVVGLSVLAIEDGSFQFVVAPCANAAARGEEGSVILLAPRRCEALLDELAPALRSGAAPPAPNGKPCDVVVAVRRAGQNGRSLAITATALHDGWDASVVCAPEYVLEDVGALRHIRPWGDSSFRELESGSLLAVMSVAMREPVALLPEHVASWKRVLTELAGAGRLDDAALRTAVFVRSAAPTASSSMSEPGLTSGAIRRVSGDVSAEGGPRGRLSVTVAAETRDTRETMVKGDLVMARFARLLMTGETEATPGGPRVQFEILDSGPRSLRVGEMFAVHPDLEVAVVRGFGESPILSWSTVNRPGRTGWWVASMSSAAGAGARESRVLATAESGVARARLSIGMVRPAALGRWMSAVQPEMEMAGAQYVESLKWDSWLRADGKVEAAISVRMVAPVGK